LQADIYVILDNVQFKRRHFENRNKIRSKSNEFWITVPLKPAPRDTNISEIEISYNEEWQEANLKRIYHCYSNTLHFKGIFRTFEDVYSQKYEFLADLNIALIKYVLEICDIEIEVLKNSDLDITTKASNLIFDICQKVDAQVYFSGESGKRYLNLDDFKNNNIDVHFQQFVHPEYTQLYLNFIPNLSILDFLFNCGVDALKQYLGSRDL